MEKIKWITEKRIINDLIPFEHNPRQMSEKQARDLKKSLEKFDLAEIPAINTDNMIIAGHQRLKLMQLAGRGKEEIDVRIPNRELTLKEVKEYNIRSNKNTGSWDWDMLNNAFDEIDLKDWGFESFDLGEASDIEGIDGGVAIGDFKQISLIFEGEDKRDETLYKEYKKGKDSISKTNTLLEFLGVK